MKVSPEQFDRLVALRNQIHEQSAVHKSADLYVMYDKLRLLLEEIAQGEVAAEAVESEA